MPPSLTDPRLKLERAEEHLGVLHAEMGRFTEANPFRVTDYESSRQSLYIRQFEAPVIDLRLAILAGEAMCCLRSALDHIAWQLALTTTDEPSTDTCFPILAKDSETTRKRFRNTTRQIPSEAVEEIESLQPYHQPDYQADPLWKLNALSNIDKHRVIPAYGTVIDSKVPRGVRCQYGFFNNKPALFLPIATASLMKGAPPPVGDIVFGSRIDGLEVKFGDLARILEYVRDTVFPEFSRFFAEQPLDS